MATIIQGKNYIRCDFDSLIKGSTFEAFEFKISEIIEGIKIPVDLTGANISIWWRRDNAETLPVLKKMILGTDISITDTNVFQINKFVPDFDAGKIYYDVFIELANGDPKKYIYGILPIKEDSTDEL